MKVQIVVFDGFDELDAIAPFEVLKTAAEAGADVRVELVTLNGASEVVASQGLRVRPEGRLDPDGQPDVLVVPAVAGIPAPPRGRGASLNAANCPRP